jgi:inosine triphosphate pyrophosphatase
MHCLIDSGMKVIYFATANQGKIKEAKAILKEFDVRQAELDLPELQGKPEDVVRKKAEEAYKIVKKPVFVDDTGLAFNALGGMPGIYVKWFLDALGNEKLPRLLDGFSDKLAVAFSSIGYCDGKSTNVFLGECKGRIVEKSKEAEHFGWDPVFMPEGHDKTFAEMAPEEKNKISHRRRSLEKLREFLIKKRHM